MGRNLALENLTKRFGALTAVDRVNLETWKGIHLFPGPSGCGKTTVLRMITGFETVTDGKVIFDGEGHQRCHPSEERVRHRFPVLRALPEHDRRGEHCLRSQGPEDA
jgi:ABC-type Fe3+/spermidine/putrescine transport system ATPase subunit